MKSWLIFLLLSLGRCSGDMNRSETLYQGYPFSVTIPLPDFKGSKHDVSQKEEVPFIVDVELTDGAILFHGIPLQGERDEYHATIGEPEGEHFDIWINFVVKERNESDVECGLHPAAVIDMGAHAFHEENRTELYDTIKEISENIKYSMNLMKVRQPEEPEKDWLLHMMAPKSCSSGNFEPDVWETINRVEADSKDGILKIGQKKFGFRRTKEFTEHSGRIANAGGFPIDGRSIGTEEATTEPITTEAAATSTTVSPTTTTERMTTSTTTEPTTTSTTTERVTTSTTAKPTTTTEATTTSTTAKPTTTSTTERPAKFTSTELSATSTTTMPPTERAVTIIRETDEALLHRTTEIPALTEEDVETVARADEYYPEALPKENSGASVARPLFAVIVLLALASAVAVFTIARARNVHRKTFVIGNASPEEINDIVVLGRDDAFH